MDKKFERRDAENSNFFKNNDDSTGREVRAERETRNYTPNREFRPRREGSDNRRSYNPNFTNDNRVRKSYGDSDNNNSFRPRRENGDGEFRPRNNFDRNRSEGGFRPRRESDGEFRPRNNFNKDRSEGGFRPRRENDGEFRPRNNFNNNRSEGGFRPRRENDGEFRPRNNFDNNRSEGGFRPRRENDGEFRPRNNFNNNRSEGGFRPRRENDGEFRPRNNFNNNRSEGGFRPRRENDGEFRPRNNFNNNRSEGSFRHNNDNFNRNESSFANKEQENTQPEPLLNREVRLNRYISMSGICSRREADTIITDGLISVNDVVITELGTKIKMTDEVKYNGEVIRGEKKVYIVMNKPKGFITTVEDIHAERTVIDLLKGRVNERVYPVGRLDKNTMGVLLLTNDGDLTKTLTHPSYNRKKIYHVFLDKNITEQDMERIAQGVELEDGIAFADEISIIGGSHREVGVEIHNGRNRIVRRMFEHFGYKIMKLDRVYFGGITKKGLQRGFWRYLTPKEIQQLHRSK